MDSDIFHVQFPNLGWSFTINRIALQIGSFKIYWYGVIIMTGLLLAVLYAYKSSKRYNVDRIFGFHLWPDLPEGTVATREGVLLASANEVDVVFTAKIDKGWHVYSTHLPEGGPQSAVMHTEKAEGAEPVGELVKQGKDYICGDGSAALELKTTSGDITLLDAMQE